MRSYRPFFALVVSGIVACSSSPSGQRDSAATGDANHADLGRITPSPACDRYLSCLSAAEPEQFPAALLVYKPDGPCWQSASAAAKCETACKEAYSKLAKLYPKKTECGGNPNTDGGAQPKDGTIGDLPACRRPPGISDCDAPPNKASTKYYYCWGCNCSGPTPVAACNGVNGDCRYFADGCYPKSYTLCDQNAPDNILGLCGYCFLREAGPGHCDRLVEADAAPKDLGGPGFE